eukprot:332719_1
MSEEGWYNTNSNHTKQAINNHINDINQPHQSMSQFVTARQAIDALNTIESIWHSKCRNTQTEQHDGYTDDAIKCIRSIKDKLYATNNIDNVYFGHIDEFIKFGLKTTMKWTRNQLMRHLKLGTGSNNNNSNSNSTSISSHSNNNNS